ncbi:myb-like protein X [Biomphalaria glabrata]|uniref:Myb-like protein X n=1 Tax=Biomphalaria glabrata TaxID=6526 RepID=A0A9W2ZYC1_BIOGL|nr:myb-like protein X [Biomphalaria glabrata]
MALVSYLWKAYIKVAAYGNMPQERMEEWCTQKVNYDIQKRKAEERRRKEEKEAEERRFREDKEVEERRRREDKEVEERRRREDKEVEERRRKEDKEVEERRRKEDKEAQERKRIREEKRRQEDKEAEERKRIREEKRRQEEKEAEERKMPRDDKRRQVDIEAEEKKRKEEKEEEERKLKAKEEEEERKLKEIQEEEEERKLKERKEEEERKLKEIQEEEERKLKEIQEEEERKLKEIQEEEERKLKEIQEEEERKLKARKEEEERKLKEIKETENETEEKETNITEGPYIVYEYNKNTTELQLFNNEEFKADQKKDTTLARMYKKAQTNVKQPGLNVPYFKEGILVKKSVNYDTYEFVEHIILPLKYTQDIIEKNHNFLHTKLASVTRTKKRILDKFYWPSITKDVKKHVSQCQVCQMNNSKRNQVHEQNMKVDTNITVIEPCEKTHETKVNIENERALNEYRKLRNFEQGDKVKLWLPDMSNKLIYTLQGPFPIIRKISNVTYEININKYIKVFHVHMLEKYNETTDKENLSTELEESVTCLETIQEENEDNISEPLPTTSKQIESIKDIDIDHLKMKSMKDILNVSEGYSEIFHDVPDISTFIDNVIDLKTDILANSNVHSLTSHNRDLLQKDLKDLLEQCIHEHSNSTFSTSIVLQRKLSLKERFSVDFGQFLFEHMKSKEYYKDNSCMLLKARMKRIHELRDILYQLKQRTFVAKLSKFVLKPKVTFFNSRVEQNSLKTHDNIVKCILNYKEPRKKKCTDRLELFQVPEQKKCTDRLELFQVPGKKEVANLTRLYSWVKIYFNTYVMQLFIT